MLISSKSSSETKKFATKLAKKILKSKPHLKHARIIALVGDLGAGKTTFTQGFAKGLGIKHRMVSPTFLIFRNYSITSSLQFRFRHSERSEESYKTFYHVDVYRIDSLKELNILGFKEILQNPENIVLIEWADKIKKILPKDTLLINFQHGSKENERVVSTSLRGAKRRGNLTL